KSAVFITHRLGAARIADRILVIDGGAVAESGSHDELVKAGGIYAEMFSTQKSWYEDAPGEEAVS
ncbi:MAG: ABC transporter ATP-binding protein, partial [Clostridia bacterium]|nr:ABC transporter ATP-binding protein [Clostridia bacterium]